MCIWAPFPHSLVTGNKIGLEKLSLFDMQNLGLLVNTLAVDDNYPVLNTDNLMIPIQMQLYQKKKTFSAFFPAFLKSSWNFERFQAKGDPHIFCVSDIMDSKNVVR